MVKLSLVNFTLLKQIIETYAPLADMGYISKDTVRSQIPGIDPYKEKKLLALEREDELALFESDMEEMRNELTKQPEQEENKDIETVSEETVAK